MQSNKKRWKSPESFSSHWSSRTQQMADLIPIGSSVIEFGVGLFPISKCIDIGNFSKYTATDFVKRDGLSFIYDLNSSDLKEFEPHDVAFFSGVLEYIHDLPLKIKFVSERVQTIIASYSTLDNYPTDREIREWVNSYTDLELISIFENVGFNLSHKSAWKNQTLYVFTYSKND